MLILTGAAGFIGSNMLAALNAAGYKDILIVDDLTDGAKCANLANKDFKDYRDQAELFDKIDMLPKPTAIIHQGACADTTCTDGRYMMQTNYAFSKRLLNVALRRRCPFIYASSAAVYGTGAKYFKEGPAYENARTPYAFSKWAFDQYVRRVAPGSKIPVVGLRYFNVYGPNEQHKGKMASAVWRCLQAAKNNTAPELFEGSDRFFRDFVYVQDVIRVNMFFLELAHMPRFHYNGIYNVGTGVARSFEEIGLLAAKLGNSPAPVSVPFPAELRNQYQDYTCADIFSLRSIGYSARFTTLEDGMTDYWQRITTTKGLYG
jgi:ADP-L-glycero-D-manno-heptose 6-epimerase